MARSQVILEQALLLQQPDCLKCGRLECLFLGLEGPADHKALERRRGIREEDDASESDAWGLDKLVEALIGQTQRGEVSLEDLQGIVVV